MRTLGRMRGRACTQPFLVENRRSPDCRLNEVFLLLRWACRSPPHQSPSVTASPQGEASGLCSPTRKKRPKSGHVHGHRTSPTTVPLRPATPKRASGNERALKKGGRGPSPATLCVRAFSRESLDPPPGTGRETHAAGANLRHPPPSQATPGRSFFVKKFRNSLRFPCKF